jgi:hypothetical protein
MKCLRPILLCLAIVLLPTSLFGAEGWQAFGVKQFGFIFDVPPGFVLAQRSDQGAAFEGRNDAFLTVWGARLGEASFRAEIEHRMVVARQDGWRLTYKRLTPGWASYSGLKGGQILYVRAIQVCRDRAALFSIMYNRDEKAAYDRVIVRMVRSLKAQHC